MAVAEDDLEVPYKVEAIFREPEQLIRGILHILDALKPRQAQKEDDGQAVAIRNG